MRIWHHELLPALPDAQFKGQLRELVVILRDWRDKGATNHLLINKVMEYDPSDLTAYFLKYEEEYRRRYGKPIAAHIVEEFILFAGQTKLQFVPFWQWHNKAYLRVCMANLYEKHIFGVGKSRITDAEWQNLAERYYAICGEEYKI